MATYVVAGLSTDRRPEVSVEVEGALRFEPLFSPSRPSERSRWADFSNPSRPVVLSSWLLPARPRECCRADTCFFSASISDTVSARVACNWRVLFRQPCIAEVVDWCSVGLPCIAFLSEVFARVRGATMAPRLRASFRCEGRGGRPFSNDSTMDLCHACSYAVVFVGAVR